MTFGGRLAAPLLLAWLPALAQAAEWQPFLRFEGFAHAEPVSVHSYVNDWDGRFHGGSDAVTHNWLETGVRHGVWSVSYVQRYDWELRATDDTAELYYLVKNKLPLPTGRRFDLGLAAYHIRSQGLRVAHRFEDGNWSIEPGLSLLSGQEITHGGLQGQASAVGEREYAYDVAVRYFYDEDLLFDRRGVQAPDGSGYSLDLALRWQPHPRWQLSLSGRDLYGHMHWRDTPVTQAVAVSREREFDENGYLRYRPTLTGREFNEDYRQRLHAHGMAETQWQARDSTQLGLRLRLTEVRHYASLTAMHEFAPGLGVDMELMGAPFALGAGLRWAGLRLAVMSDRWKFEDARVLQLQLGWSLPL